MQRTFNPQNGARYPGGPPLSFASWCNSSIPGFDPVGLGANPSEAANHSPLAQNQSGSLTNCGRWRVTSTGYQFRVAGSQVEGCKFPGGNSQREQPSTFNLRPSTTPAVQCGSRTPAFDAGRVGAVPASAANLECVRHQQRTNTELKCDSLKS